ncbi:di-heme oxidoredictase family protein [Rhizobium halophytocola]|uniref:CxxC motif-containing protein (DUF1111 family) n=1 Tax=Rhizobium halophytocola TaxID=735519 RepID=A0ABS4E0F9_9HYPH|nr:di-heme oxidoredictase family protein [Rhizobium halophytocola]MBP1851416.1 CxxC motif-containing protein (DUF1111 family) [Rhizobium halophytocola]
MFDRQRLLAALTVASLLCPPVLQAGDLPARTDLDDQDRLRVERVVRPAIQFDRAEASEALSGGAATSKSDPDANGFHRPSGNLAFEDRGNFHLGQALFEKFWVSSPSSTQASDGLGPLYNARSCHACHIRGGRGQPLDGTGDAVGMLVRLARPATTDVERAGLRRQGLPNAGDPVYGRQFQDRAVPGLAAEGKIVVSYEERTVTLPGAESVVLRKPRFAIADPAYGPVALATTLSPRMASPLIGMGLIEAVAAADIAALADPQDRDGDGISGRVQRLVDPKTGAASVGRFGWKAQTATVREQAADALSNDIGISTPLRPDAAGDCTEAQVRCRAMPDGVQPRLGPVEAPDPVLGLLAAYTESLAVPMRRNVSDARVLAGKATFYKAGCAACHVPKFVTSRKAASPAFRFQLIWPYSDFLLHDMGEDLADGQGVGAASGREWRTPPLWGIGLTDIINGHSFYLHDGRARTLTEAILWHGGEATAARNAFAAMDADRRAALITFLESL